MRVDLDEFPSLEGGLDEFIAKTPGVRMAVDAEARAGAARATAILRARPGGRFGILEGASGESVARRMAPSYITVEEGLLDRYVILNDQNGDWGAMSIEYGRKGGFNIDLDDDGNRIPGSTRYSPPMAPVAPLRKAFGIF